MRKRELLSICLVLFALLSGVAVCAQDIYKLKIPTYDEPFHGTWINTQYAGSNWKTSQKFVYSNWGYAEVFKKATDEAPSTRLTFILVEKWTDAKGKTWYRQLEKYSAGKNYMLCRISRGGRTLEQIFRSSGFPAESDMGPGYANYWIYYRK